MYNNYIKVGRKNNKKTRKSIGNVFGVIAISISIVVAVFILVSFSVVAYVSVSVSPSLKYRIGKKRGLYPEERELGASVWVSESPSVKLTIFNDRVFGEISVDETTYFLQGYFFFGTLGFSQTVIDQNSKSYIDDTVLEAEYKYIDGKIEVSNVKFFDSPFLFEENFVLEKEKSLDESQVKIYQCEETNMLIKMPVQTDFHSFGVHQDLNNLKIEFVKRTEEYYFLNLFIDNHEYVLIGKLKTENDKIVFDIMSIEKHIKDVEIHEGPLAEYFPKDLKCLTFTLQGETRDG